MVNIIKIRRELKVGLVGVADSADPGDYLMAVAGGGTGDDDANIHLQV